jgi:YcaO-like protein with predicted kinase domain
LPLARQHIDDVSTERFRHLTEGLRAHGLTRLADQTGLDRLAVPCMAAIRPNARTVTTHQGKGDTSEGAAFSALMEAAEYAFAETVPKGTERHCTDALDAAGHEWLSPEALLPRSEGLAGDRVIGWLTGYNLTSGEQLHVPRDMVALVDPEDLAELSQSTNGLAAGFDPVHARIHGLCELIERDAMVLWGFRNDAAAARTEVLPASFGDPTLAALCTRIDARGVTVRLFDMTSDIGVPAIYAVMTDARSELRHGTTSGAACHPIAATAARKAVLEAAQTRVSMIAGVRDDIAESQYERAFSHSVDIPPSATFRSPPNGLATESNPTEHLKHIFDKLMDAGLREIVTVPIGGAELGIHVEKLFVPGLEDRLTNRHWRPGRRAVRAMLRQ